MRYVIALFVPPFGPLLCGRLLSTLVNLFLCLLVAAVAALTGGAGLLLIAVPIIHAWASIHGHNADRRMKRFMDEMRDY